MTAGPREWTYDEVCDALERAVPHEVVVHAATSGSTGTPKVARLTAGALTASARSTLTVLGGPGQWLLSTPATHIAGIQVLVRSALAGIPPVTVGPGGFTSARFSSAAARLTGTRRYTSLVPTQVARLLADDEGRAALARFDAVLVGGAAVPDTLRAAGRSAGTRIVATYGMSETAGGCVYDGRPLPGARMRIGDADPAGVGVIELGGPMLASGYVDRPEQTALAFGTDPDGSRWFRTDDLGRIDEGCSPSSVDATTSSTPGGSRSRRMSSRPRWPRRCRTWRAAASSSRSPMNAGARRSPSSSRATPCPRSGTSARPCARSCPPPPSRPGSSGSMPSPSSDPASPTGGRCGHGSSTGRRRDGSRARTRAPDPPRRERRRRARTPRWPRGGG